MMKALATAIVTMVGMLNPLQLFAENAHSAERATLMVESVLESLKGAQTIALCDFKLPAGTVITRVLRGDPLLAGKLWNARGLPRKPVLVYECTSDHLGGGSAQLMTTGYFELDEDKKAIVLDSTIQISGDTHHRRVLVPLAEIQDALAKKKAEQGGAGHPATSPESKSEGGDKPQPEAEKRSR